MGWGVLVSVADRYKGMGVSLAIATFVIKSVCARLDVDIR